MRSPNKSYCQLTVVNFNNFDGKLIFYFNVNSNDFCYKKMDVNPWPKFKYEVVSFFILFFSSVDSNNSFVASIAKNCPPRALLDILIKIHSYAEYAVVSKLLFEDLCKMWPKN